MAFEDELPFLAATCRRGIEDLRGQLRALEPVDKQATYRGRELAMHVDDTLHAIEAEITRLEQRFPGATTDKARLALVTEMRFLNHHVQFVHEATPWLEHAEKSRLALGVIYFIDEAVEAVVQRQAGVVAAADPLYMYSTHSWPFRPVLRRLGAPPPAEPVPIILFYPAQEAATTPLHTIFVHELGHAAIDEHELADRVFDNNPDQAAFDSAYATAVAEYARAESINPADAAAEIDDDLSYWLEEIICDALAFLYLGPSYLLSFAAFGLSMSRNEPSRDHPPLSLRLRLLLTGLEFDGWSEVARGGMPKVLEWLDDVANAAPEPANRAVDFLRDAMIELWPTVYREMKSYLGQAVFSPGAFATAAGPIEDRLNLWILPAQLEDGAPADRRALLLAGWLHMVQVEGDSVEKIASVLETSRFHEFLAKALEMSAVAERWVPVDAA